MFFIAFIGVVVNMGGGILHFPSPITVLAISDTPPLSK
jgi:hypothetical protein